MAFANDGAMFHRRLVYKDVGVSPGSIDLALSESPAGAVQASAPPFSGFGLGLFTVPRARSLG